MQFKHFRFSLTVTSIFILMLISFWMFFVQHPTDIPPEGEIWPAPTAGRVEENPEIITELKKESSEKQMEFKTVANLNDLQKASSLSFPFIHQVSNGLEWIKNELEEYLVLKYQTPMLQNDDIKGIQQILKNQNLYRGRIDGIYGLVTQAAVKRFQEKYGLTPTGIIDLDDYHLLAETYDEENVATLSKAKPKGKITLLIVLDERVLYVLEDGKVYHKFPVAIGKQNTPSPIGNWKIISKDNWGGGFGTRWLGLSVPYGRYGIHGTNKPWSISGAESHGCFRMYNRDVETLYEWVTWGTKVYVVGGEFPYNLPWRVIDDGDHGSDVWMVQNRLKELGYYSYNPDGVFGWGTRSAVMRFQKDYGLEADGKVSWGTLDKLGLYLFQ